jgi:hypothetical protein
MKRKLVDTEIAQNIEIVEIYWHDHSLESSGGTLTDGPISFFLFYHFWGKMHFLNFLSKNLSF